MLTAITFAMIAGLAPPARYDFEPAVPYHVTYLQQESVQKICADDAKRGDLVLGCSLTSLGLIYIAKGLSPQVRAVILRHEKAHINGWPHHYPELSVALAD